MPGRFHSAPVHVLVEEGKLGLVPASRVLRLQRPLLLVGVEQKSVHARAVLSRGERRPQAETLPMGTR